MKRFTSVALSLLLVLSLIGCQTGNNGASSNTNSDKATEADKDASSEVVEMESDVLVIGGGGTGLVAALSAAEKDASVILLEKQDVYGGATSMSSGKIPASGTPEQEAAGIEDTNEENFLDIYRAGAYSQNKELLKVAVDNATPIKTWLEDQGIKWNLETDNIYFGQSKHRIHVAEGSGAGIVNTLVDRIEDNDKIQAYTNMPVKGLLSEDGVVMGAYVEKDGKRYEFKASSVVLATSGFGANREMVEKYTPSIVDAVPNVAPGATGDGILWGMDLGAETKAMNAFQAYAPISFETHKSLGSAFLDNGGILVNNQGRRFINEYIGYSPLGTAIVNQEDAYAWMIWDSTIQDMNFPSLKAMNDDEIKSATSPKELAKLMDVDADNLAQEFFLYEQGINNGEDYLNRTKLPEKFEGTYYAIKVTGDFRHTQGGLVINPETAEVLKEDGSAISNLYAGGGVTEGFSSDGDSNYMAGNGLLQAFVFGRIAGQSAADNVQNAVDADAFNAQKDTLQEASQIANKEVEASDIEYQDGEYTGVAEGYNGPVEVKVTVKDSKIDKVDIVKNSETEGIGSNAIEKLPELIVKANGTEGVDSVTGASKSSQAIFEAVEQALKDAK